MARIFQFRTEDVNIYYIILSVFLRNLNSQQFSFDWSYQLSILIFSSSVQEYKGKLFLNHKTGFQEAKTLII